MTTKTVKIRAHLLINSAGKWAVYGWNDAKEDDVEAALYEMMGNEDVSTARKFIITAEIPLPESIEISGVVETIETVETKHLI